ncbi:hypothetical protein IAQ61_001201 [Plenodomus lingam]|uniref:Predicted protein n=1 Tax=Leptosphaeria maculans (strain JN3 / isolate v23.1.3 / race Av1-4-5-6-7-8) TaxID=985895 RepID=E5A2F5_LEPMJ|nr:predicted protein [Plenodomus lingam JN3]KAH9880907.1 hypothetical protein IAQ61_001201 [Plenodomus lingam]CBX97590.1 predicted protein [Plenodomus lingam JN3]
MAPLSRDVARKEEKSFAFATYNNKISMKSKDTSRTMATTKSPFALASACHSNKRAVKDPKVAQSLKNVIKAIDTPNHSSSRACKGLVEAVRRISTKVRRNTSTAYRYLKAAMNICKGNDLRKRKHYSEEDNESLPSAARRVCLGLEHPGRTDNKLKQDTVVDEQDSNGSEMPWQDETSEEHPDFLGLVDGSNQGHSPPTGSGDLQYLCGHWVHPAHTEVAIDKKCPRCCMRTCLKDVVCAKRWLIAKGDPRELSKDRWVEYMEILSGRHSSTKGENLSLTHSKAREANLIAEMEELCKVEKAWMASREGDEGVGSLSEYETEHCNYGAHEAMRLH